MSIAGGAIAGAAIAGDTNNDIGLSSIIPLAMTPASVFAVDVVIISTTDIPMTPESILTVDVVIGAILDIPLTPQSILLVDGQFEGFITVPLEHEFLEPSGYIIIRLEHELYATGTLSVPLDHDLSVSEGFLSVPLEHDLYGAGTLSVVLDHNLYIKPSANARFFKISVTLGNVDITALITGKITVRGTESKARIADFDMRPVDGVINPYDWISQPITINYIDLDSAGTVLGDHRLFTGIVHRPAFNVTTRITHFKATDNLQETVETQTREFIDGIIPGHSSAFVFNEPDNNWDYAQNRLATIPSSYDLDVNRSPRVTPWAAKSIADFSYTPSQYISGSLNPKLSERRNLINQIDITFGFRYARNWQRDLSVRYVHNQSFIDWLVDSTGLPTPQMFNDAVPKGWVIKSSSYTFLPPRGDYIKDGFLIVWLGGDGSEAVLDASLKLSKRWRQTLTEQYTITVKSDASIDQHGKLNVEQSYKIDAAPTEDYQNRDNYDDPGATAIKVNDSDFIDPAYKDGVTRADFNDGVQAAIAEASTRILSKHRANTLKFQVPIEPTMDVNHTAEITGITSGKGKCIGIIHTIDINAGNAVTEATIAIYQPTVASQINDSIVVPDVPDTSVTTVTSSILLDEHLGNRDQVVQDSEWTGFISNFQFIPFQPFLFIQEVYEEKLVIEMPEIKQEDRDEATFPVAQTYQVAIPEDPLTLQE